MSEIKVDKMMELVNRREWLCKNAPVCPECKNKQIQLLSYFCDVAEWKCRVCKYVFDFEPPKEQKP